MIKNKKIRNILKHVGSFALFLLITVVALQINDMASAQTVEDTLRQINQGADLPGFETGAHADASYEEGASNITSAILYIVDLLTYGMGTIAVAVIVLSGIRLITSGKQIEEVASKQKENIKWAASGLVVIMVAQVLVKQVLFGESGELFRSEADSQMAAETGRDLALGIANFLSYFAAAIAVLMIILQGMRLLSAQGKEESVEKAKKTIMWAVLGLILIGIANVAVFEIFFPDEGSTLPDTQRAAKLIIDITNFISGFIATVAIAMFMYGGYLYVISSGQEDQGEKAKKVFIAAAIGLLLAMGAFALVNTFIEFEAPTDVINTDILPGQGGP